MHSNHPIHSELSKVLEQSLSSNNWSIRRKEDDVTIFSSFISAAFFPQKISFTSSASIPFFLVVDIDWINRVK